MKELMSAITLPESGDEVESIATIIMENLFGLSRTDLIREKPIECPAEKTLQLQTIAKRLNAHEPVQYILEEASFYGRLFKVSPAVLIPRQETELLIDEVKDYFQQTRKSLKILDIGTGSGCIPVTLALEILTAYLVAIDVSVDALSIAKHNADLHSVGVQFSQMNILAEDIVQQFDVVVSNPPYIVESEKATMQDNVLKHEPSLALFVPDKDPLLFYRNIALKSFKALTSGGLLATEINERFGKEIADLYGKAGFEDVTVVKDINGKDRVVKAFKL